MANAEFDLIRRRLLAKASAAGYIDSADAIGHPCMPIAWRRSRPVRCLVMLRGSAKMLFSHFVARFHRCHSGRIQFDSGSRIWISTRSPSLAAASIEDSIKHLIAFGHKPVVWSRIRLAQTHLCVTGHSLGGALAILAGMRLHEAGIRFSNLHIRRSRSRRWRIRSNLSPTRSSDRKYL